ncbi:hypothetical protein Y1Q_0021524 [Alligator mississippiensis]|uniref:Uncharacterized protein n=1 Tax=Alligator mississippiensis TaxID=8496 RepID=A0A151PA96_ALLMI|nr:hypothetical protein Y1Q_0021524 [Alligator mississippiensis]
MTHDVPPFLCSGRQDEDHPQQPGRGHPRESGRVPEGPHRDREGPARVSAPRLQPHQRGAVTAGQEAQEATC